MGRLSTLPRSIIFLTLSLLLLSTILVGGVASETPQNVYQGSLIDAHYHYSFGNEPNAESSPTQRPVAEAIAQMKQAGIVKVVAFSELEHIDVLKTYPEYFIPFFQIARRLSPDDPTIVDEISRALDRGFIGIGEIAYRSTGAKENVAADSPLAKKIVDLAAERGAVIEVHQEVGTKTYGAEYIPEFERLLDYNKNVTFILAHVGFANPETAAKLVAAHSNLYADLSDRTPGHALSAYSGFIGDDGGAVSPTWRAVLEKFPDRFMFGTDNVFETRAQKYRDYLLTETAYFRKVLGQLPLDLAEKIGYTNIQKVMKMEKPANSSTGISSTSASVGLQKLSSNQLHAAMSSITVATTEIDHDGGYSVVTIDVDRTIGAGSRILPFASGSCG